MKVKIFFLCLTLLLQIFTPIAFANEMPSPGDSLNIPAEEMEGFEKENDGDLIVRLYCMDVFGWIGDDAEKSLQEHINSVKNVYPPRLVSVSPDNLEEEGDLFVLLQALLDPLPLFEKLNLAQELEIYERYAFEVRNIYDSAYVYYVTNRGNYIYYNSFEQPDGNNNAYLIPEAIVGNPDTVHMMHLNAYHPMTGGRIRYEESFDLSTYQVQGSENVTVHQHDPSEFLQNAHTGKPTFLGVILIVRAVAAAVIGGIAIGGVIYNKKKKR